MKQRVTGLILAMCMICFSLPEVYAAEHICGCVDCDKDHFCDICGATVSDHFGTGANCVERAICDICGKPFGEPDPDTHRGTDVWTVKTDTKHECKWSCCGEIIIALEDHQWGNGACRQCGYVCGHIGGTVNHKERSVREFWKKIDGVLAKTGHLFGRALYNVSKTSWIGMDRADDSVHLVLLTVGFPVGTGLRTETVVCEKKKWIKI